MSAKPTNQKLKLKFLLKELNDTLEAIIQAQFGIKDKQWVDGMRCIEGGFAIVVDYITDHHTEKGSELLTTKEIEKLLEEEK